MARAIDPKLAPELLEFPFIDSDRAWRRSLASRDLVRGRHLELPSGPAVARGPGIEPFAPKATGFADAVANYDGDPGDIDASAYSRLLVSEECSDSVGTGE